MKALLICSGGFDSVTLAYRLHSIGQLAAILCFDYGQRHKKEIDSARLCAERLNVPFIMLDISSIGAQLGGSALTDDVAVPHGAYNEEHMQITTVPNRNAIMLSIAFGVATARGFNAVATAVHGGEHHVYADCRPEFIDAMADMQRLALADQKQVSLLAPYVELDKTSIARDAARYKVPIADTWSCYEGGELHCGQCATCIERMQAMAQAGVEDPTAYATTPAPSTAPA